MKMMRFLNSHAVSTRGHPILEYTYISVAFLIMLLLSGIVFGWSSLMLVLQAEGVYSELCVDPPAPIGSESGAVCAAQSLRFDLVFVFALLAIYLPTPFHGWMLDRFGARISNAFSSTCIILGFIMFAFGYHTTTLDLISPAIMLIATGGMGVMLSMLTIARIKPDYISIILAFYNVGFDSSPIVFYIYVKLYQSFHITPKVFFLAYTTLPILSLLLSIFWPKGYGEPQGKEGQNDENTVSQNNLANGLELSMDTLNSPSSSSSETDSELNNEENDSVKLELDLDSDFKKNSQNTGLNTPTDMDESDVELSASEMESNKEIVVETSELGPTDLYSLPFVDQLKTREAILLWLVHAVFSFWLSSYMGSVQSRLTSIEPPSEEVNQKIKKYTETFGLILSLAFLSAPIIGYAIHKLKLMRALFVGIGMAILWSLCQFLPSINLQIITFIVFALVRAWYYSIIFNAVTHLFGWTNVGKLWGVGNALAGVVTFGFYGVSWAVINLLDGSYVIPNIAAVLSFSSTLLVGFYLLRRKQNWEKQQQLGQ